jgi:putative hydrolase of the HAD superfamily
MRHRHAVVEFHVRPLPPDLLAIGNTRKGSGAAARLVRDEMLDARNYSLFDDTVYILEKSASLGYRNYILSNNFPELDEVVRGLELAEYFDGSIISAKVGYENPGKKFFTCALRLAAIRKSACGRGQSGSGYRRRSERGHETVLVHNSSDCGADHVFDTLSEIAVIL